VMAPPTKKARVIGRLACVRRAPGKPGLTNAADEQRGSGPADRPSPRASVGDRSSSVWLPSCPLPLPTPQTRIRFNSAAFFSPALGRRVRRARGWACRLHFFGPAFPPEEDVKSSREAPSTASTLLREPFGSPGLRRVLLRLA